MKANRSSDPQGSTTRGKLIAVAVAAVACGLMAASLFQPSTQGCSMLSGVAQKAVPGICARVLKRKLAIKQALVEDRKNQALPAMGKLMFDLYEPAWTCLYDRRLGTNFGDGGKFVCGDDAYFQRAPCLVYSVGSNGNTHFEQAVVEHFGCEVHTFDPTGNSTKFDKAVSAAGAEFHTWGLAGAVGEMANKVDGTKVLNPLLPLGDIVQRLGHAGRHIDILKIDCEGCEYEAFSTIWSELRAAKYTVGQIQIELHLFMAAEGSNFKPKLVDEFFSGADNAGFAVFHKERNHWGCAGFKCVEFSLIHLDEARQMLEFELGC